MERIHPQQMFCMLLFCKNTDFITCISIIFADAVLLTKSLHKVITSVFWWVCLIAIHLYGSHTHPAPHHIFIFLKNTDFITCISIIFASSRYRTVLLAIASDQSDCKCLLMSLSGCHTPVWVTCTPCPSSHIYCFEKYRFYYLHLDCFRRHTL